jgi:hypothetical protein
VKRLKERMRTRPMCASRLERASTPVVRGGGGGGGGCVGGGGERERETARAREEPREGGRDDFTMATVHIAFD